MNLYDTAVIQIILGLSMSIDKLKEKIDPETELNGARIRVSDRMQARLTGPNFVITAVTPEIQAVSRSEIIERKWEVKSRSKGNQNLHLALSALLSVDGSSVPRSIRTFERVIDVEVTWRQRAGAFFDEHWKWLWAAILVPIGGWLWKRKTGTKAIFSQDDG